jgi:hypothetical protein
MLNLRHGQPLPNEHGTRGGRDGMIVGEIDDRANAYLRARLGRPSRGRLIPRALDPHVLQARGSAVAHDSGHSCDSTRLGQSPGTWPLAT